MFLSSLHIQNFVCFADSRIFNPLRSLVLIIPEVVFFCGEGESYPSSISSFTHGMKLKLTSHTLLHKRLQLMTSLLQLCDMGTIYRLEKGRTDALSLRASLPFPSKFIRCIGMTE